MSHKSTFNAKQQSNNPSTATSTGSSLTTSALDRLRNNLSPVTSYYKPLMKTFTRRDESPSKVSTYTMKGTRFIGTDIENRILRRMSSY